MARELGLVLDGVEYPVKINKVDRKRLYGDIEIEAFDESGEPAYLRYIAEDGQTIIDAGGTALATISEDGDSVPRNELIPVDAGGKEIEPVPSSFGAVNQLKKATHEEYLSAIVKSVYTLDPATEEEDLSELAEALEGDVIYKFDFSYRGGLQYDEAFLIGEGKNIFMIVGVPAALEFVSLNQAVNLDDTGEEQDLSVDDLDFDLM
jgi:hypothetical protein